MGAYSQLDAELRYGGNAFVEDEADEDCPALVPVEGEDYAVPSFEDEAEPSAFSEDGLETPAAPASAESVSQQSVTPPTAPSAPTQNNGASQEKAQSNTDSTEKAAEQADEDAKRKAHEESEARRKAEFDAKQAQKKAEEQKKLDELAAMSDDEVMAASMKRVSTDTEKLTRRNMKECVAEYIQTMCIEDPAFARKVMHPRKSMVRCFQYINQKAYDYIQDELKASGIQPGPGRQGYGCDIPDDLCYQWAVDYFNDLNAKIDHEDEEKFVPKTYPGGKASKSKSDTKGKSAKKKEPAPKKEEPKEPAKKEPPKKTSEDSGQISFGDFAMPEEKAG